MAGTEARRHQTWWGPASLPALSMSLVRKRISTRIARPCTRRFGPRMKHCRGDLPVARIDLSTRSHGRPAGRPYTEPMFPEANQPIRGEATDAYPPDSHHSLWLVGDGSWHQPQDQIFTFPPRPPFQPGSQVRKTVRRIAGLPDWFAVLQSCSASWSPNWGVP